MAIWRLKPDQWSDMKVEGVNTAVAGIVCMLPGEIGIIVMYGQGTDATSTRQVMVMGTGASVHHCIII